MTAEVEQERRRYTIAVDFDGVLHSYVSGWVGHNVLPDPPVDGAIDWLNEVAREYDVLIFTTRARYPEAVPAIEAWLREHGFTGDCTVTHEKGPALLYLDDRAWRFKGAFPSLKTIRYAKPWRVGDPHRKTAADQLRRVGAEKQSLQNKQARLKFELREAHRRSEALHEALHHALAVESCDYCDPKAAA